jgi:hypothetical protein
LSAGKDSGEAENSAKGGQMIEFMRVYKLPVALALLAVGWLVALVMVLQNESVEFRNQCVSSGFNKEQCDLLAKEHDQNTANSMISGFAIGLAAGRR